MGKTFFVDTILVIGMAFAMPVITMPAIIHYGFELLSSPAPLTIYIHRIQ